MAEKQPDRRQIGLERECHRHSADRADPFRGPFGRRSAITVDGGAGPGFGSRWFAAGDEAPHAPLRKDGSNVFPRARPRNAPGTFELGLQILNGLAGFDQLPREARRVIVGEQAIGMDVEKQQTAIDRKPAYPHRRLDVVLQLGERSVDSLKALRPGSPAANLKTIAFKRRLKAQLACRGCLFAQQQSQHQRRGIFRKATQCFASRCPFRLLGSVVRRLTLKIVVHHAPQFPRNNASADLAWQALGKPSRRRTSGLRTDFVR